MGVPLRNFHGVMTCGKIKMPFGVKNDKYERKLYDTGIFLDALENSQMINDLKKAIESFPILKARVIALGESFICWIH